MTVSIEGRPEATYFSGSLETPDSHGLTFTTYRHGKLAISESGRDLLRQTDPHEIICRMEAYRHRALGHPTMGVVDFRSPLGQGSDGAIYELSPESGMVVKEIRQDMDPFCIDPTYPLWHMEELRHIVASAGQSWLGVPRHYSLFLPDNPRSAHYLTEQKVEGYTVWDILNKPHEVPEAYNARVLDIFKLVKDTEQLLHGAFRRHGRFFDDEMEDWGPHNIIAELEDPGDAASQLKFWIVDQVAYTNN